MTSEINFQFCRINILVLICVSYQHCAVAHVEIAVCLQKLGL